MTITTSQSVAGHYSAIAAAGSIAALGQTGPQSKVSPSGSTVIISGVSPSTPSLGTTIGIATVTAGFDPAIVAALTVKLKTTGQVWPVGFS